MIGEDYGGQDARSQRWRDDTLSVESVLFYVRKTGALFFCL